MSSAPEREGVVIRRHCGHDFTAFGGAGLMLVGHLKIS